MTHRGQRRKSRKRIPIFRHALINHFEALTLHWQVKAKTRGFCRSWGFWGVWLKRFNFPSEELPGGYWGFVASWIFGPWSHEALEGAGRLWLLHFRASCVLAPLLHCHSCLEGSQHWHSGKEQKLGQEATGCVFLRCSHLTNFLFRSGIWGPECILFMMMPKYILNFF